MIGLGGGAALDVAKAIALMATHPGDVLEYAWDHPQVRPIDRPTSRYFIALPTTAGTGSEVGRSSVVSDDVTHVKKIIFSPQAPGARRCSPIRSSRSTCPPPITAATGMDALTHNVESYLSPDYHPLCDGIALEGVRIAARALPIAVRDGRNLQARSDMLMSSMMGAIAFQKDLGAVHSCAHALSTVADLHHGLANGIMIDHVMRFNLPAAAAKMAELARVAGVPGAAGMSDDAAAQAFIAWLGRLKADLGIPATLGAIARARRGDEGRHPGAGRRRDQGHLPPDQSAQVHARGLRADLRRSDVTGAPHPDAKTTRDPLSHAEDRHLRLLLPRGSRAARSSRA